ncbi:YqjD family protein [Legionella dresdenensis]|uniref:YqjD family protein n=1 Tax=Legionella dresdenensis TaxID=450200 RepID=A0ABV8CBW1_9GAMM
MNNPGNVNEIKSKVESGQEKVSDVSRQAQQKADDLYHQTKEKAGELYEEGVKRVHEAQDTVKEVCDSLIENVKERPLTSILVAGGVGFILASLLRSK